MTLSEVKYLPHRRQPASSIASPSDSEETRKAPASEPSTVRPHTRRAHVLIQAVFRETLDQAAKNPAPSPLGGGFH